MAVYLQIENLTKSFGDRIIFNSINFGIEQGDKIGIIAKNGTGKSSLLKIIAGKDTPDSGNIIAKRNLRIGFVEQTPHLNPNQTIIEACLDFNSEISTAIETYQQALDCGDSNQISEAIHLMDVTQAWDYDDQMKQLLHQLKITDPFAKISTLSGGQKKRVAIARVIISSPDLIILDEPTNHLDIEIIEWLQEWLTRQNVTLLMVTHDRYFLDAVCNKIIEIDNQTIYQYKGNYDYYLRRRQERINAMGAELAKIKNTLRKEQEWMSRQPQARAGKAKYRIDAFYDLKNRAAVDLSQRNISLKKIHSSYIGNKIFEAKNLCKSYADKIILNNFSYTFARYEKLGLIGTNGVGKSTLIKILQGIVNPDSGTVDLGQTIRFGYYSQDGITIDKTRKVIDVITEIAEQIVLEGGQSFSPMQFLNSFLFSPADQQKYIHTLSGGELCRLHLATVLMRRPNFLILDEPTNDLDIVTLGLLEEYLQTFDGCLIVVSHDRFFLDSIVDHIWVMEGAGQIKDFPGTYTEYREYKKNLILQQPSKTTPTPDKNTRLHDRTKKMTFQQRRQFEQLTIEIEQLTAEKKSIDQIFNSPQADTDITQLSIRYNEINQLLDEKELRWLELSELE